MRLLITGGAGFIGSAVVRHCLRNTDHHIVNVDSLTYAASLESLEGALPNQNHVLEQMSICDESALRRVFELHDPDAVLHLAAESHVDRSIEAPRAFVETNINGTFFLLQAALRHFERLPASRKTNFRFLHVSTDEVYGSLAADHQSTEDSPTVPNSPYSASKAASDMLVRAWHRTFGLPTIVTNCSNNYGPFQYPEKLVPVAILAAIDGLDIPVYGDGRNIRDWIFVDDHVRALLTVLERGKVGEKYNIGGDTPVRNVDLVRLICRTLDRLAPSDHRYEDKITFVQDRPGHDLRYAVDSGKLQGELGWRTQVALEKGLADTIAWYLSNRAWCAAQRARGGAGRGLL